ncbi:MAG: 30S ribosomal protein S17 [archaeon]|jgi:small subunit ribosomal protein S17
MVEGKKEVKKKVVKKETTAKPAKASAKKVEERVEINRTYPIRGNVLEGEVTSAKANKTITVKRQLTHYISKYERYKKVFSKVKAHVPSGMIVKEGDKVQIGETRRISKTKNFVLIKVISDKK